MEASLPLPPVAPEALLPLPGNDDPPRSPVLLYIPSSEEEAELIREARESHVSEPGTERVEAAKDELPANQEHCLSQAAKKRRF